MYILGIDPGTGRTGWGVIDVGAKKDMTAISYVAHGCVVTSQDFLMQDRLLLLHSELSKIIKTFSPTVIVVEHIFFGRNTKTAISVSQARGVIMLTIAKNKIPMFEYTSIAVKHNLSGTGKMEKKEMQVLVRRLLGKNIRKLSFNTKDKGFDDAADGLALAIHHALKIKGILSPIAVKMDLEKEREKLEEKEKKKSAKLVKKNGSRGV